MDPHLVEKNPSRVQAFAGPFPPGRADAVKCAGAAGRASSAAPSAWVRLKAAVITADLVDMGISSIWVVTSSNTGVSCAVWVPTTWSYPDLDAGKRTAHLVGGRMVDYIRWRKDGFHHETAPRPRWCTAFSLEELDLRGRRRQRPQLTSGVSSARVRQRIAPTTRSSFRATLAAQYFANRP